MFGFLFLCGITSCFLKTLCNTGLKQISHCFVYLSAGPKSNYHTLLLKLLDGIILDGQNVCAGSPHIQVRQPQCWHTAVLPWTQQWPHLPQPESGWADKRSHPGKTSLLTTCKLLLSNYCCVLQKVSGANFAFSTDLKFVNEHVRFNALVYLEGTHLKHHESMWKFSLLNGLSFTFVTAFWRKRHKSQHKLESNILKPSAGEYLLIFTFRAFWTWWFQIYLPTNLILSTNSSMSVLSCAVTYFCIAKRIKPE